MGVWLGWLDSWLIGSAEVNLLMAFLLVGIGIGSFLPDIDHPKSMFGSFLCIGDVLSQTIGHRGLTHSLIGVGIVGLFAWAYWDAWRIGWVFSERFGGLMISEAFWIGLLVGYVGHLIGDMFERTGVPLFMGIGEVFGLLVGVYGMGSSEVRFRIWKGRVGFVRVVGNRVV